MSMLCSFSLLARLLLWLFVLALFLGAVAGGHLAESRSMSPVTACELGVSTGEEVC
jgi:hypothetical protein